MASANRPKHQDYTTLPSLQRSYETMPRQLAFRARTREEWAVWQEALHKKLVDLLGGFPLDRPLLNTALLQTQQEAAGYRLEKVAFQAEPGLYVPCYVLTPRHVHAPYRPVIALPGHGSGGAAHTIGNILNESDQASEEEHIRLHNYDYGRQLVRRGFMVFVPEQRGIGERLEAGPDTVQGEPMWRSSCRAVAFNAMLLGKTAIGLRVWDVIRTVDYIRSRPEPMVAGIGCVGFSGGGATALFSAALEPRITATVVSGYLSSFRESLMSNVHCECNYVPGILKYAEMSDLAALIAPRPLLIESGTRDPIYPAKAAKAAYKELQRVYGLLGVSERLDRDFFAGGHQFNGRKAFDWLARWL
jgi:dienelactone hydrolase